MNEHLRDRIVRKLDTLSEERAYQVLDYIEFLASKYAERPAPVTQNVFTRFTEAVEDRLRAGKVSSSAIAETMSLMNRAVKVLDGVAAAGRSVATDLATAATGAWTASGGPNAPASGEPPVPPAPPGTGAPAAPGTTDSGEVTPPGAGSAG
ncbi:MAG TPA: hypothetical protein VFT96_09610 [Gemmatimonadaceae bacterium]|nr:hypothetical protein [Gemmatimonadaceae bacterium]